MPKKTAIAQDEQVIQKNNIVFVGELIFEIISVDVSKFENDMEVKCSRISLFSDKVLSLRFHFIFERFKLWAFTKLYDKLID